MPPKVIQYNYILLTCVNSLLCAKTELGWQLVKTPVMFSPGFSAVYTLCIFAASCLPNSCHHQAQKNPVKMDILLHYQRSMYFRMMSK